tara:strand:+ start:262 stop:438 length:177 start_codon:yes stop_codon:yes gene_type:complete
LKIIARVLLLVLCFFAAIASYAFGIPSGGVAFLVLGIVFEGLFWTGIFSRKKKLSNDK